MAAALVWLATSMLWAGGGGGVCHRTGPGFNLIEVASSALPAHLAHGDHLAVTYFADVDLDGFGDPSSAVVACAAPEGWVANGADCDDQAAGTYPGAVDACGDGIDQDCSGGDALCSSESGGWLVTAGRIEQGEEPGTIYGTYTFVRLPGGEGDLRGGGGCLVADLFAGDPSYECNTDDDCAYVNVPGSEYVYCASPDGSGEPNRCWVSLTNHCLRSPFRTAGEYGTPGYPTVWPPSPVDPTTPGSEVVVPVPGDPGLGSVPVRWMVLACMSVADNPLGCSGDASQHVYSTGPVTTWSPTE